MFTHVPLHHYQKVYLDQTFKNHDISIEKLSWPMRGILPEKYFDLCLKDFSKSKCSLTKELLQQKVISAGTLGYESLIAACLEAKETDIAESLTKHGVKEVFRFVWIWSEDNSILSRGKSWFTSRKECLAVGKVSRPRIEVADSPHGPFTCLALEATCVCQMHNIDKNILDEIDMNFVYIYPCACADVTHEIEDTNKKMKTLTCSLSGKNPSSNSISGHSSI